MLDPTAAVEESLYSDADFDHSYPPFDRMTAASLVQQNQQQTRSFGAVGARGGGPVVGSNALPESGVSINHIPVASSVGSRAGHQRGVDQGLFRDGEELGGESALATSGHARKLGKLFV